MNVDLLLKNNKILYSQFYSSFLSIPNDILSSKQKLILFSFIMLNNLNLEDHITITQDQISYLTGIPKSTIAKSIPRLPAAVKAANSYLQKFDIGEQIEFNFVHGINSNIYEFLYTTPTITSSRKYTINKKSITQFNTEKINLLLNTGFEKNDILPFTKYSLDKIKRSVDYFIQMNRYNDKGIAYLNSIFINDYGKVLISSNDKLILKLIDSLKITEEINKIRSNENISYPEYKNFAMLPEINDLESFYSILTHIAQQYRYQFKNWFDFIFRCYDKLHYSYFKGRNKNAAISEIESAAVISLNLIVRDIINSKFKNLIGEQK